MGRGPLAPARAVAVAACANLGGLISGIHLSLLSGLLESPSFASALLSLPPASRGGSSAPAHFSAGTKSLLSAALMLAFTPSAPFAGLFAARYGRRPTLLTMAALFLLAAALPLLAAPAPSVAMLVGARVLAGVAHASANVVCPMYTAEIAPPALRGALVNFYQLAVTVGILVAQVANLVFATTRWQVPFLFAAAPAAAMLAAVALFVPESPAWEPPLPLPPRACSEKDVAKRLGKTEAKDDRTQETSLGLRSSQEDPLLSTTAKSVTHGGGGGDNDAGESNNASNYGSTPDEDPRTNEEVPATSAPAAPSLLALVRDASVRRRLAIGVGLCVAQQWSGFLAVIFYAPALISDALSLRSGASESLRVTAALGAVLILATVGTVAVSDRVGRRALLLRCGPVIAGALLVLGALRGGLIAKRASVVVASLFVYICAFALSYGALPFVVAAEIFPIAYRAPAIGACTLLLGLSAVVVGFTFLPLLRAVGGWVYVLYAACMLAATGFVWTSVPETKNLTLDEVDALLRD